MNNANMTQSNNSYEQIKLKTLKQEEYLDSLEELEEITNNKPLEEIVDEMLTCY